MKKIILYLKYYLYKFFLKFKKKKRDDWDRYIY